MSIYWLGGSPDPTVSVLAAPEPIEPEAVATRVDRLNAHDLAMHNALRRSAAGSETLGGQYPSALLTDLKKRPGICLIGDGTSVGSPQDNPEAMALSRQIGALCAQRGWRLFAGGTHGLLGRAIEGALDNNGDVVVVTSPQTLQRDASGKPIIDDFDGRLRLTAVARSPDHAREYLTALADGMILLPYGGINTIKTLSEIVTQTQINQPAMRLHHSKTNGSDGKKPVFICNELGHWDALDVLFRQMVREKLLSEAHKDIAVFKESLDGLLDAMQTRFKPGEAWPESSLSHAIMKFNHQLYTMQHPGRASVINAMRGIKIDNPLFSRLDHVPTFAPDAALPPSFQSDQEVRVLVFSGAKNGKDAAYCTAGHDLGRMIGESGARLVNGGGNQGIMNSVIVGAHAVGGNATAILPADIALGTASDANEGFNSAAENFITANMHWRKRAMNEVSDIVMLAAGGGFGSLDETLGELYWNLVHTAKPTKKILVDNRLGLWDGLHTMLEHAIAIGAMPTKASDYIKFYGRNETRQMETDLRTEVARIAAFKAAARPGCPRADVAPAPNA